MQVHPVDNEEQGSHPIEMAESFRLGATTSKPFDINHTTEGLIKLLMYGDYVKARAYSSNASVQSVITEDLDNYPYKKKESFQVCLQLQI